MSIQISGVRNLAEQEIAQANPKHYDAAAPHLKKIRDLLIKKRRKAEWMAMLRALRETHARKSSLQEVLTRVEKGRSNHKSRAPRR